MPEWKLLTRLDSLAEREIFDAMYALYEASFPEDSEREARETWVQALHSASTPYRLEFCVAAEGAAVAGAAAFEYYPHSRCGLVTFLFVDTRYRSRGIARGLMERVENRLIKASRHRLRALFAEAEDPERARAAGVRSVLDPGLRLQILHRLGAQKVEVRYVQPALGPGKEPVQHLSLLLLWPRDVVRVARSVVEEFLLEFYDVLLPDEHAAAALIEQVLAGVDGDTIPVTSLCT